VITSKDNEKEDKKYLNKYFDSILYLILCFLIY